MNTLTSIPRIGPKTIEKLNKLGIHSPINLIYHFPSRYIDFSNIQNISDLEINTTSTIHGELIKFNNIYTRSHKNIQIATISDTTGTINLIWFNQPYLSKNFIIGEKYSFAGTVSLYQNKKTIIGAVSGLHNTGKIIAAYPETSGLSSNWFRQVIPTINIDVQDPLPSAIQTEHQLLELSKSLHQIHQPTNFKYLSLASFRLGLDEILSLQSAAFIAKSEWSKKTAKYIFNDKPQIKTLINRLPFSLTESQTIAWQEIKSDLLLESPSNRLLQGDVGSGKTIIALLACYLAHLNKTTSVLIAPTEILAQQHLATFQKILKLPMILLTGKSKPKSIPKGSIVISTHAAIYQKDSFQKNIGLLIIDEQHKFGVKQRSFLTDSLHPPHCLTMTATPIPRTVSLTIMGNLDLSTLTSVPASRLPIKTYVVPQNKYPDCYLWLEKHIKKTKEQAFIVCPFIEPSETMATVKDAKTMFDNLSKNVFPTLKLALIHGKIPQIERQRILDDYANKKVDILVTTPIIEVGIDFPNATTIIIQSSDRFGLAQLHQLRGRVGRSNLQSYCYLFSESVNEKSINRLKVLQKTTDGQKIAEYDLATRGPGEAFSVIQHGFPSLKIANFNDLELIKLGQKIIAKLAKEEFDLKKLIKGDIMSISTN